MSSFKVGDEIVDDYHPFTPYPDPCHGTITLLSDAELEIEWIGGTRTTHPLRYLDILVSQKGWVAKIRRGERG